MKVDDLLDFLELLMFINASLPQTYYLMKWIGDWDIKKNYQIPFILFKLLTMTYANDL